MATQEPFVRLKEDLLQTRLHCHYRVFLKKFRKTIRNYVRFNFLFIFLFSIELILFAFSFSFSSFVAILFGSLFLTIFSYLVLLFYFQAKKPEQLNLIQNEFISSCRKDSSFNKGQMEHHLSIAHAMLKLTSYLHGFENHLYQFPFSSKKISSLMEKFSAFWHWKDVFRIKEILLKAAIEEHIYQIRHTPTDFEVHTSLANTYVALSKLYLTLKKNHFVTKQKSKKYEALFQEKLQLSAQRAIEEFKILKVYAPDDPWIHLQLAKSYYDLELTQEEVHEYESALKLRPDDEEILFRLGVLYFELGYNAKGLQIYNQLKQAYCQKADDLITFFGCYRDQDSEDF